MPGMNSHCDRCREKPVVFLAYGKHAYCKAHFNHFFEKRIYNTIRRFDLIKKGEKIALGVSGGKDSVVMLHALAKNFSKKNKLIGICIDEGITGYRKNSLKIAEKNFEELGIEYNTYSYKEEYGKSLEKIMKKINGKGIGSSCAFCGVFRRDILNSKAIELGANKLATGHNLDDECQSIVMNIFNNDFAKMQRIGAINKGIENSRLIARIKPLYKTPENEVIAYAGLNKIDVYSEECCPYSSQAKRNYFREMLNSMEEEFPGTKFSIQKFFLQLKPLLLQKKPKKKFEYCENCGRIASNGVCMICNQLKKIDSAELLKKSQSKKKKLTCLATKRMVKKIVD